MRDEPSIWAWRLFVACALAPIAASLAYGALYSVGLAGLLSEGFTLRWWRDSLGEAELWRSLALSVAIAVAVVGATVPLSLAIALGLRGSLRRGPLSSVLAVPLALPASVAAFVALQTLGGGGLLSRLLGPFPAPVNDPLSIGVILTHTVLAVPFFVIVFSRLHESERLDALEELARSLGAGRARTLRRVTLPVLLRAAAGNILLLGIVCLGSYEIPLLLGRQSPEMLSVFTMRKFTFYDIGRKPEAYVAALVYTVLAGLLVTLAFRRPQARAMSGERGSLES